MKAGAEAVKICGAGGGGCVFLWSPPEKRKDVESQCRQAGFQVLKARPTRAGLETNYNTVPFDPRKPFDPSGIRLGTPALTTRGLREEHMPQIAAWIDEAVSAAIKDDEPTIERIAAEVRELLSGFPMAGWAEPA